MPEAAPFKQCTLCGTQWPDLKDLVLDPNLVVNGYQAHLESPEQGLILVTHQVPDCGTTLVVAAGKMRPLYRGPNYSNRQTGTVACRGHCQEIEDLQACTANCDMAWIREALQWIVRHELPPHFAP